MRCPKCGYISFDRQRSCGKCSNDLTAVAEQLQGTVGKAAAPFFLGAVLGKKTPSHDEPEPALQEEEEETLSLDEFETEALPTDEEELDFAGAPLDDDDLEDQPLPSLGLEDIDVSDLVPPQEEEEELVLSLGSEQEEAEQPPPAQDEDDSLMGIELPSLEPDDLLSDEEKESSPLGALENEAAPPQASAEEDEEIIDLSSLMSFDEEPEKPADKKEDQEVLELSLGAEPDELHLSLDDGEAAPAPAEAPKKPASAVADIPDLGLTLESDDK